MPREKRTMRPVTTRVYRTKAEAARYQRERDVKNAVHAACLERDQTIITLRARIAELEASVDNMSKRLIAVWSMSNAAAELAAGKRVP